MADFQVIKRAALPASGGTGSAELRDFRWCEALCEFVPAASRFSMCWLNLGAGDALGTRLHAVRALLIVCAGSGEILGDLRRAVIDGDVVVIPAGREYGLVAGHDGLTAILIQFEGAPNTSESPDAGSSEDVGLRSLEELLDYSAARLRAFERCSFFTLLDDGTLDDPEKHSVFLEAFATWSKGAEGLLFNRHASALGEAKPLRGLQNVREARRDAVIEAIANWFAYQMYVLDGVEGTTITRLVVEPASAVCARHASSLLGQIPGTARSSVVGAGRRSLVDGALRNQSTRIYVRLGIVVREAWDMLDAMADRVVELTRAK